MWERYKDVGGPPKNSLGRGIWDCQQAGIMKEIKLSIGGQAKTSFGLGSSMGSPAIHGRTSYTLLWDKYLGELTS